LRSEDRAEPNGLPPLVEAKDDRSRRRLGVRRDELVALETAVSAFQCPHIVLRLEPLQRLTARRTLCPHPDVAGEALEAVFGEVDIRVEPEQFGACLTRLHDPVADRLVPQLRLEYTSTVRRHRFEKFRSALHKRRIGSLVWASVPE
jgi:hypothetical protein